jgi:exfoliative toxin A/B
MLAYATLGNLLGLYTEIGKWICGFIGFALLISLIIKVVRHPQSFLEAMKLSPVGGCLTTLPMGIIILTTYLKPFSPKGSVALWLMAIGLYLCIMIVYTLKHVLPFKSEKVLASYFVTYVGIVVVSVTSKTMGYAMIGQIAFYFGLISYCLLLPMVIYRYVKFPKMPEPIQPLIMIFAAPANLLVVGYVKVMTHYNGTLLLILIIIGWLTTLFSLSQLPKLIKSGFYPSYAAFTFPIVIGALASKVYSSYYSNVHGSATILNLISYLHLLIAIGVVGFVSYSYSLYMIQKNI